MKKVTIPAVSRALHKELLEKYDRALDMANKSELNFVKGRGRFGIVTNGVSYTYVMDALQDLGLKNEVAVLRLGFTHPFPARLVVNFLKKREKVLVVEELEPYMEIETRAAAQEAGLTLPIAGKSPKLLPRLFEFDPGLVRKSVASYFGQPYKAPKPVRTDDLPKIPSRPPNLCPGCPHRATFYAVKSVAGDDMVYPTDIGCYTLGVLPPLSAADYLLDMGSSITTACGISKATGRKTVAFIGDSTFFHSGITGLVDAVHNRHNVLLVILDNGTTAMTGQQVHPGVDASPFKRNLTQVKIESLVRSLGIELVQVVKPRNIKATQDAIREALAQEGVSVIISKEMCPLYARKIGEFPKRPVYEVDREKCTNHRDCLTKMACPAFCLDGNQVMINPDLCIGCAVCAQVCPEHAIRPAKKGGQS